MPSADSETEEEAVVEETDEARQSLLEAINGELGDHVADSHLLPGKDLWIRVTSDSWSDTADYLRNRQRFRFFDWLSAVDWLPSPFGRSLEAAVDESDEPEDDEPKPGFAEAVSTSFAGGEARFQVLARVYNLATGIGLNVKADVREDLSVGTWTDTYPGADWHEREAFEMFGVRFEGHPGLRKLYLPGDFEGYPLRKDYPLMARLIKPWPGIVDVEPFPDVEEVSNSPEGTAS